MIKVLFVCLGNVCRSPMAEAVLRHKLGERGLSDLVEVDSAGTDGWEIGGPPHQGTRGKLDQLGISCDGIVSRQLTRQDIEENDYVVGMDLSNLRDMKRIARRDQWEKLYLLSDFIDGCNWESGRSVPDPWYSGNFDLTHQLIDEGCDALLEKILDLGSQDHP